MFYYENKVNILCLPYDLKINQYILREITKMGYICLSENKLKKIDRIQMILGMNTFVYK